ncbi:hypothetical protein KFK09_014200 [Dendrobium nobile]|uniref:Endonuclease/exonuclease/phosphatase domain-containing protein n=1 Tax=Dendrobium nobile TaxID=94219 RepID=A0A8T3BCA5_DENNO|nr:hypothetical protein KFK09_014200 [Dendrobium nobile]
MSSILFWNCRGARKKEAALYLKELIRDHDVCFVGLLETKLTHIGRKEVDYLIGNSWDYFQVPTVGLSSGMVVLWDTRCVSFMVKSNSSQVILGDLLIPKMGLWKIATVYGSRCYNERDDLWRQLEEGLKEPLPSIIGGDFNCILNKEEKRGGKRFIFSKGPREMKNFKTNSDFHDIRSIGPKYTWCNNKEGTSRIWERLDRCLLNSIALQMIPKAMTMHLARVASDHCPIAIKLDRKIQINRHNIKFEDTWRSYPAARTIVYHSWSKNDFGEHCEILQRKNHRTLKALFFWSKCKVKNLKTLKEELKKEIIELQKKEMDGVNWTKDDLTLL